MYLTNASISALFRRIELFAALSGLFFAHNSLKINCFHHWDGLYPNKAKPSSERSYYVSSRDPTDLSPPQFLSKIRNHWAIENKNHYPRDRFFDEDRCMIRNHNAARILAACRQLVLSLKSTMGFESTPALCDHFTFNLHKAINIIT